MQTDPRDSLLSRIAYVAQEVQGLKAEGLPETMLCQRALVAIAEIILDFKQMNLWGTYTSGGVGEAKATLGFGQATELYVEQTLMLPPRVAAGIIRVLAKEDPGLLARHGKLIHKWVVENFGDLLGLMKAKEGKPDGG